MPSLMSSEGWKPRSPATVNKTRRIVLPRLSSWSIGELLVYGDLLPLYLKASLARSVAGSLVWSAKLCFSPVYENVLFEGS